MGYDDLRQRLRADTRSAHDAVDAVYARFDLAAPAGRTGFLRAQGAALAALGAVVPDAAGAADDAARDLLARGGAPAPAPGLPDGADDPLGAAYIWEGSRQGAVLLARRWHAAGAGPSAFFARPPAPGAWRELCARLAARPAAGPEADRAVAAATAWFALFERAALAEWEAAHA